MIEALTGAILPVFAVLAAGFLLGLRGVVGQEAPAGINRFVLLLAVPALLFSILAGADLSALDPRRLGAYVAGEATVYAAGFLIARFGSIPQVGDALEYHGARFEVAEGDERRVSSVRVTRLDAGARDEDEAEAPTGSHEGASLPG